MLKRASFFSSNNSFLSAAASGLAGSSFDTGNARKAHLEQAGVERMHLVATSVASSMHSTFSNRGANYAASCGAAVLSHEAPTLDIGHTSRPSM